MNCRPHAFPLVVVALFVVAACAVSFAHAADAGADLCGAAKGWGPVKSGTGQAGALLLELAAIPVGLVNPVPTMSFCVALREAIALPADHGPPQRPAPRAPPVA
jgi:hypothetical protein